MAEGYSEKRREMPGKMSTRIYIGRLNYDVRERDLEKFFKGYGRIREILLKNGFGFVEFDDYRDADDAVYELNGKELLGERVTIEHARGSPRGSDVYSSRNRGYRNSAPPNRNRRQGGARDKYGPPTRTEFRLIVENLSSRVSWQDLKDYMRQAGEVTYADAHKQRRNEGAVEFASFSDMKNALDKLDDTELNGRRITLREDKSRSRRRSRSRSTSRSRSRSRSKGRRDSRSKSHSESKSRSRSRSRSKTRSRSKSISPAHDKSRSRSRSVSKGRKESKSRSQSKSRSRSPIEKRSDDSPPNGKKIDETSMDDKD